MDSSSNKHKDGVYFSNELNKWVVKNKSDETIGAFDDKKEALIFYSKSLIFNNPMLVKAAKQAADAGASVAGPLFYDSKLPSPGSTALLSSSSSSNSHPTVISSSTQEMSNQPEMVKIYPQQVSRASLSSSLSNITGKTSTTSLSTSDNAVRTRSSSKKAKIDAMQVSSSHRLKKQEQLDSISKFQMLVDNEDDKMSPSADDSMLDYDMRSNKNNNTNNEKHEIQMNGISLNEKLSRSIISDSSVSLNDSMTSSPDSDMPHNARKYRGVSWQKVSKAWIAQCKRAGKTAYVGLFNSPEDAARAYDLALWRYGAKESQLNFGAPVLDPNNPKDKEIIDSRESYLASLKSSGSKKTPDSVVDTSLHVPVRAGKRDRGNTSQYRGVSWYSTRRIWKASIQVDKKKVYIGRFSTEEDAARAYNEYALRLRGHHATLNVVADTKTYVPPGWNENNSQKKKAIAKPAKKRSGYDNDEDGSDDDDYMDDTFEDEADSKSIDSHHQEPPKRARNSIAPKQITRPVQATNAVDQTPVKRTSKSRMNSSSSLSSNPAYDDSHQDINFSGGKIFSILDSANLDSKSSSKLINESMLVSPIFFGKGMLQSPIGSTPLTARSRPFTRNSASRTMNQHLPLINVSVLSVPDQDASNADNAESLANATQTLIPFTGDLLSPSPGQDFFSPMPAANQRQSLANSLTPTFLRFYGGGVS